MTDKTKLQAGETLPEPQDVQEDQAHQQVPPCAPHQEQSQPADTAGYDLAAGSQPATRGASGHRA